MKESIHSGHRGRLKERYRREGLDNFDPINALELLLFYCIPRIDTNPLAHRLLDRFGTINKVLEAPRAELIQVEGVSENTAVFLSLIKDTCRYYMVSQNNKTHTLNSIEACAKYLRPYFIGRSNEAVYVLCLDGKCQVISCELVSEGTFNSAPFPFRKVVEVIVNSRAASVLIAHNHPGGIAVPSQDDSRQTRKLAELLRDIDVVLVDHLVFADDGDYVSMQQSNYYDPRLTGNVLRMESEVVE